MSLPPASQAEVFTPAAGAWLAHLGTLRQVVRQHLVAAQLDAHLPAAPPEATASGASAGRLRVLDLGCGQGTQLLRLARAGHEATGVDVSAPMLDALRSHLSAEQPEVRARVRVLERDVTAAAASFPPGSFDLVLCHGLLMYLPDPEPLIAAVARILAPGGLLSLLVRNGDALAWRAAAARDWPGVIAALAPTGVAAGPGYTNRLGLSARADRRAELTATLAAHGLEVAHWYGVRALTDFAADDEPLPEESVLAALLAGEERAASTDPYRAVAPLTHLLAAPARPAPAGPQGPEPVAAEPGAGPGTATPFSASRPAGH